MTFGRIALRLVALALVFALGTAWYGWWTVPVVAFVYAVMDRAQWHRGRLAAGAAVISWGGILTFAAMRSAIVWSNSERIASLLQTSPLMLFILTLMFAALLAGPAAVLGAAIAGAARVTIPKRYRWGE
ncbi:MAG: hypothetical protein ACR2GG_11650 [Gemmatimonadaceae bacterium]